MKDTSYIIFAGILFVLLFAVFGIILYFNMLSEVKIDSYSEGDILLNNLVNLTDHALQHMLYMESPVNGKALFVSNEHFIKMAGGEESVLFLNQDVSDIFIADSFWAVQENEKIHIVSSEHIEREHPFLSSSDMNISILGYNSKNGIPAEILSKIEMSVKENRSYGFFETKKYLVNYRSSTAPRQKHKFTLIYYRLKSETLSHINDTTIMFVVLLILAVIIIAIFIIFYINAVANLVMLEERKKKEIELLRFNRMLTMERLSESIVHNIKNPLTNVKGYLQIMLSKKPELMTEFKLDIVMKNLNFVIEQLKSILVKNRASEDSENSEISLNSLVINEIDFLRQLISKNKIDLETDLEKNLPYVSGNYNDFKMMLLNLIDNAVDSMIDSSVKRLIIRTQYFNRNIVLSVEDTGCGMSERVKERLFEMYFTTKTTTPTSKDDRPVGTGIGLFSVLKLVQKYNGKIEVSSILNKGSIFTIKFPVQ